MASILAADIGGTHSRFAVFETAGGEPVMGDVLWLDTGAASSFAMLLDQARAGGFPLAAGFDAAVLAVAGPVSGGKSSRLSNVPWGVDLREVDLGARTAWLVNDFTAQAYACRTRALDGAKIIQQGRAEPDAVIGVIGAGTGLGCSALIPTAGGWSALSSEGGHMAFPFVGPDEARYEEFNRREGGRGRAEGDTVVSGPGLRLLHRHLTGQWLSPGEISASIGKESDTARWFARFYGRACRNWAMAVMPRGGLVIAGGVAAKNPMLVTLPEFLEEFHTSHVHADFLRSLPVVLNANEHSGLYGAAFCGMQRLVDMAGDGR